MGIKQLEVNGYKFPYPPKPSGNGIYVYFNTNGDIAYIGKSWQKNFNGIYDRISAHHSKDLFGQPENQNEKIKIGNGELSNVVEDIILKRKHINKYCYLPVPNNCPK
ncbi:hypothetical protein ACTFIZ_009753 [Dictyostelium cf. discoideum]